MEPTEDHYWLLLLAVPGFEFSQHLFEELSFLCSDGRAAAVVRLDGSIRHLSKPQQLDESVIGGHYPSVELRDQLVP